MRPAVVLFLALLLAAGFPLHGTAAPIPCPVTDGVGVGVIRIGMGAAEALRLAGTPAGRVQGARVQETVYLFSTTIAQITVEDGRVSRVATRHATCVTARGVRIGDTEAHMRVAYERAPGLLRGQAGAVTRYVFPFTGIEFVLTSGRVTLIEVFRAGAVPLSVSPTPTPAAASEGAIQIRSLVGRVQGTSFVVSGSVTHSGPPLALFVEVVLYGLDGGRVAEGTTTLVPNPIGGGRAGAFEVRLAIDQVVRRFLVAVRGMNRPTVILAQMSEEVKEAGQFADVVLERLLDVTVLGGTADRASGTHAAVTNRSAFKITGLAVQIKMSRMCRTAGGTGTFFPSGQGAVVEDARTGTVRIAELPAQARVEVPIDLSATGPCIGVGAEWQATWTVLAGKIEEEKK